jgi:hypothetical protein
MGSTAALMPHLALQLALRICFHYPLALLLNLVSLVDHPFIRESMLSGPNCAKPDVFGEVSHVCKNLRLRNLGKTGFRVDEVSDRLRKAVEFAESEPWNDHE